MSSFNKPLNYATWYFNHPRKKTTKPTYPFWSVQMNTFLTPLFVPCGRVEVCAAWTNTVDCVSWLTCFFNIVCPQPAWIGHKGANPFLLESIQCFVLPAAFYSPPLRTPPPHHNHTLFLSATTPRKPRSNEKKKKNKQKKGKKPKGNFSMSPIF